MDMKKTGELLCYLRKEKGLTQKQAAEYLQISDRTVSKWERGAGMPEVSLWNGISALYGVEIGKLLEGDLQEKEKVSGNMKRMQFYCCGHCGAVFWSTGSGEIFCCGRKLQEEQIYPMDERHDAEVAESDNEYYIRFTHEMEKGHFISFAALVSWDRVTFVRLYPEQSGEVRMPRQQKGDLYLFCSKHGLFWKKL